MSRPITIHSIKIVKPLFFAFFLLATVFASAQTDTLIVRGRVENLSIELYRQAPTISLTRVNILQPNREIVRLVQLEANGNFELKMPLIYPQEECHLNYTNLSIPFLGKKGIIEITIYGDSLTTSDIPFRFSGLNATTNNLHAKFEVTFDKWHKANPEKSNDASNANLFWENLLVEQNRKIDFYRNFSPSKDTLLNTWVISSLKEAAKARFYSFLSKKKLAMPLDLLNPITLDTTTFLTFAKADYYQQFGRYASNTAPTLQASLPVETLARLLLQYTPNLQKNDSLKLASFANNTATAKKSDLNWLDGLAFLAQKMKIEPVLEFELYAHHYGKAYNEKDLDYLKAVFYTTKLYNFKNDKMNLWYKHIRPTLQNPYYARALDEIHHIESKDTLRIAQAKRNFYTLDNNRTSNYYSIDITPAVHVYKDFNQNGAQLWKEIREKTEGKAIYAIFWTNDEFGRRALAESLQLRTILLEERVAFVYLSEYNINEDVWIENIVKSNTRGLHIKLDEEQNDFFVNKWRISRVPYAVFVDANGKYIDRDAPLPANREGWDTLWKKMAR